MMANHESFHCLSVYVSLLCLSLFFCLSLSLRIFIFIFSLSLYQSFSLSVYRYISFSMLAILDANSKEEDGRQRRPASNEENEPSRLNQTRLNPSHRGQLHPPLCPASSYSARGYHIQVYSVFSV